MTLAGTSGAGTSRAGTSRAGRWTRLAPATLLVASTLTVMAGAVVAPVLELIRRDLALDGTAAGLVLTVHGFSLAVAAPLVGRAVDRWGVRPTLVWGLLLYGVTGASGLVTTGYPLLLAGRVAFGVGAAAVFAATTVALFELREGHERDRVMGLRSAAISLGGLGWPLVGGLLGTLSWHAPFAVYALGVPLAAACAVTVPRRAAGTAAGATGRSPAAAATLVRSAPGLLGWYALQLVSAVLLYAVLVLLPLRLAELAVTDPVLVAAYAAVLSAAMTAVGLGYARLRARLGARPLLALALGAWVVALAAMSVAGQPGLLAAAAVLFGTGMGVVVPELTVLVAGTASAALRGTATALGAAATFLGQGVSPLLFGPVTGATSVATGFAVAAGLAAVTLLATLLASVLAGAGRSSRNREAPGRERT